MEHGITHELAPHQNLSARLEEAFPDPDAETLVDTLEGLSNLLDMVAEGGDQFELHK